MNRQELMQFLDKEAKHAMLTVLPAVLAEVETKLVPDGKNSVFIPLEEILSGYKKDINLRTVIVSQLVKELEGLSYHARSSNHDNVLGITVS